MSAITIDQTPEGWSKIVSGYEEAFEALTFQYASDVVQLLALKPGERVIDVAAGLGAFSRLAAQTGAEVLATDFAPGMVARLRERIATEKLTHVTAEVMDGQALTVPNASFDASVSILGVIFFPDIQKGLVELRRVLRPGGRSAVVCWGDLNKFSLMMQLDKTIKTVVPGFRPAAPPVWARLMGAASLQAEMEKAGFNHAQVTSTTRSIRVKSPETFWSGFATSVPPLAFLFEKLGPDITAQVGKAFVESLVAEAGAGVPELSAEAYIGIGWA
jgi:ubiquinone/menaquinone biosynthesis C-methylase UbiE